MTTEATETQTEVQATTEAQASLSLNDLATLANVINLATQRGAFRANELSSVGSAYDKLNAFLGAAQKATEGQTEAPASEDQGE